MQPRKKVFAITGSTRKRSVNLSILEAIAARYSADMDVEIYDQLDQLPHFNPDLDQDPVPPAVAQLRQKLEAADGIIICTPEYVFSLPGSLKNAIEWLVSTTVLTDKPAALITASSSGTHAHESLNLVMRTVGVRLAPNGSLLIQAPKTKISPAGEITDTATSDAINALIDAFLPLM